MLTNVKDGKHKIKHGFIIKVVVHCPKDVYFIEAGGCVTSTYILYINSTGI